MIKYTILRGGNNEEIAQWFRVRKGALRLFTMALAYDVMYGGHECLAVDCWGARSTQERKAR